MIGLRSGLSAALVAVLAVACADVAQPPGPSPRAHPYPDQDLVAVYAGPNQFRIARAYVVPLPPNDTPNRVYFALRATLPDMDPSPALYPSEKLNQSPTSREVRIGYTASLFEPTQGARAAMEREAARLGTALDDFSPASPATMGWRVRLGRPLREQPVYRESDLFWANLPGRGFVGARCNLGGWDGRYGPETCALTTDWRGAVVTAAFSRVWLEKWQDIAAGVLDLLNHHAVDPPRRAAR
jgi:hypothetical protein